jgi:hypothetical protein
VSAFFITTIISVATLAPVGVSIAEAASSGPNSGSTFANDATVGTQSWSHVDRVASSNDSYADANLDDYEISEYLKVTGFGFAIPSGATME